MREGYLVTRVHVGVDVDLAAVSTIHLRRRDPDTVEVRDVLDRAIARTVAEKVTCLPNGEDVTSRS